MHSFDKRIRPFFERPDLTPYLVHLTKKSDQSEPRTAYENLVSILQCGVIHSSDAKGFIRGPHPATCFMDIPFDSLKYLLNEENTDPQKPRYEPYGVFVLKMAAYKQGCRPVLYLSKEEELILDVPKDEQWRVVRFNPFDQVPVSWIHEREWRCKGEYKLGEHFTGVVVRNIEAAQELQRMMFVEAESFATIPQCVIPLDVVCQGLPWMHKSKFPRPQPKNIDGTN